MALPCSADKLHIALPPAALGPVENRILQGDCVEVMSALPEKSVDLIFADPPYNLQLRQELWRPNLTRVDAVNDAWDRFADYEAYDRFTADWLGACRRVLKDTGAIWVIGSYHNIHRVGKILMDLGYWILNEVVWERVNAMPNFRGVRFTNAHETLIWAQKHRGARYTFHYREMKAENDGLQMRSVWRLPICSGKERIRLNGAKAHSTQKPMALLERIIRATSRPGDLVLDPFFGSGTTGAAARRLGRKWIGIESDPAYVDIARQRIEVVEELPQSDVELPSPPRTRVSLADLLRLGLLRAGDRLRLAKTGDVAIVLADGSVQCGDLRGSANAVGRALLSTPLNAWTSWELSEPAANGAVSLDDLRQEARRRLRVES